MTTDPEVGRFLAHLNQWWDRILDDPGCVPGNTWDDKVLALVRPHLPPGVTCYIQSRFDLQHGRRFHLLFLPVGSPAPPTDFDIRLASRA